MCKCDKIEIDNNKNPNKKRIRDVQYLCFNMLSEKDNTPKTKETLNRLTSTLPSISKNIGYIVPKNGKAKQCIKHIVDDQIEKISFI